MASNFKPSYARQTIPQVTGSSPPGAGPFAVGPTSLDESGVSGGTYGDATHVAQIQVGNDGRIESVTDVPITFPVGVNVYSGSGAPATLHNDKDFYFDTSATPAHGYVQLSSAWVQFS